MITGIQWRRYDTIRMGTKIPKSNIQGYSIFIGRDGEVSLDGCDNNDALIRSRAIRLPSDPEDLARLLTFIAKHTLGPLSAQAVILEATGELPKED